MYMRKCDLSRVLGADDSFRYVHVSVLQLELISAYSSRCYCHEKAVHHRGGQYIHIHIHSAYKLINGSWSSPSC